MSISKRQDMRSENPMIITSPDNEFVECLQAEGTVLFLNNWYPAQWDLEVYPHNEMTSPHNWNHHQIQLQGTIYGVQEKIEGQNVAAASKCVSGEVSRDHSQGGMSFFWTLGIPLKGTWRYIYTTR